MSQRLTPGRYMEARGGRAGASRTHLFAADHRTGHQFRRAPDSSSISGRRHQFASLNALPASAFAARRGPRAGLNRLGSASIPD